MSGYFADASGTEMSDARGEDPFEAERQAETDRLRGIITAHLNETGSSRAEEILANFDSYVPKFRLIKPKSSDVKSLLGHTSRSSAELRIQAQ